MAALIENVLCQLICKFLSVVDAFDAANICDVLTSELNHQSESCPDLFSVLKLEHLLFKFQLDCSLALLCPYLLPLHVF